MIVSLIKNKYIRCLILIVCFFGCSEKSDISLRLTNKSSSSIFNIEVRDSNLGMIKEIKSNESLTFKLYPQNDSHVGIKYINNSNEKKIVKSGYYGANGYSGIIVVDIKDNDEIIIIDEVTIISR